MDLNAGFPQRFNRWLNGDIAGFLSPTAARRRFIPRFAGSKSGLFKKIKNGNYTWPAPPLHFSKTAMLGG
jgi:hypothetical protein